MTKTVEKLMSTPATHSNPFASMRLIGFWLTSILLYRACPISRGIYFLALGPRRTRKLISALVHDLLQTLMLLLEVVVLLSWGFWHFVGPILGG